MGAVVIAVSVVHWPVLSARALSFDDDQYLLDNHLVRTPGLQSVQRFFGEIRRPSTVTGYYQPLAMCSLMLDAALGGSPDNLRPFHRTSLMLHVANSLLVMILMNQLFGRPMVAAIAGLLFGLHPLAVEPVAWVAERKTLLAGCFALVSLFCHVRSTQPAGRPSRSWRTACIAAYLGALLSKPAAVPLPAIMLLLDFWPLRRLSRQAVLEKLPLFALGVISAVITWISQGTAGSLSRPGGGDYPLTVALLVSCHNIVFYLLQTAWPAHVSLYYPFPEPFALSQPMVLAGVIGTTMLAVLLTVSVRWTRALLTGGLVFLVALAPVAGLVGFTHAVAADRHMYLPLVGILVVLAWLLATFTARCPSRTWRTAGIFVVLLAAGLEAGSTRLHLRCWKDSETLYRHMLSRAPDAPAVHLNLGVALAGAGRPGEAIGHYRRALALQPDLPEAAISLASALTETGGSAEEAARLYAGVLAARPEDAEAHNNLGLLLLGQGRSEEALAHCSRALELKPEYADAQNNLGMILAARGQLENAIPHYQRALELRPDHMRARNNLAVAFAQLGRTDEAIIAFRQALELQPGSPEAHNNLGLALRERHRDPEAIGHFNEALRLRPDYVDARVNLAAALAAAGRLPEAVEQYRAAARLAPDDADLHRQYDEALKRLDRPGAGPEP